MKEGDTLEQNHYVKLLSEALDIAEKEIHEYPASITAELGERVSLVRIKNTKYLLVIGNGIVSIEFEGDEVFERGKLCPLSHQNRLVLNNFFPYTKPTAFGRNTGTFGVGDRLGVATPGHIRILKDSMLKPVLAQQSKRELDFTNRTYEKVLDDVCFGVYQEGYHGGFGADGDHLKTIADIEDALSCGYTMITLDCSEQIGRGVEDLAPQERLIQYQSYALEYRERIESQYLGKQITIDGISYCFQLDELVTASLIYKDALSFVEKVYLQCIKPNKESVDFELSIDETESITTEIGHLFVALELQHFNIDVTSLAPRFTGEFQKGIDYIGEISQFHAMLKGHAKIADYFGYKLSIHSGSDKFSVFPQIGEQTNRRLHLKTSGTSWLEALGTIANTNCALFREIYKTAINHFEEARAFYHVSAEIEQAPSIDATPDDHLIHFLDNIHSRQILHITYGYILSDEVLKNKIYFTLSEREESYYNRLVSHIGRHIAEINKQF